MFRVNESQSSFRLLLIQHFGTFTMNPSSQAPVNANPDASLGLGDLIPIIKMYESENGLKNNIPAHLLVSILKSNEL